jgi:CRISPR-associated exonuclease Cas4
VSVPTGAAAAGAIAAGALLVILALRALSARGAGRRDGALVATDLSGDLTLRSERLRLIGRPDLLRRTADGRTVPIELKHRPAPRNGPYRSHEVQLWAYCLLIEEATGVPPPYGVLRYADGEFRVPWDAAARTELLAVRRAWLAPYRGEATPSPARCARCPWNPVCELRAR